MVTKRLYKVVMVSLEAPALRKKLKQTAKDTSMNFIYVC